MNIFLILLSLPFYFMSVNTSGASALGFIAELGTADQKATYTLQSVITITEDALKKHGVDTVEYATEDFRTIALDGEVALDNPTLRKALADVITGFAFFKNLEGLYLELQQENYEKPTGILPRMVRTSNSRGRSLISDLNAPKRENLLGFRGALDPAATRFSIFIDGNISVAEFKERYEPRISSFQPFLSHEGMSISLECGLFNRLFEGVWYLLTSEEGFFLQPLESHAQQNTLFINKLKSKKALLEIEPMDNAEKISRLQSLIASSDKAKALMVMKDLERWIVILPDLLNSGISQIIYSANS